MAHHWLVNMLQIMWQWLQTRDVICRKKINPTDYGPSANCPADKKNPAFLRRFDIVTASIAWLIGTRGATGKYLLFLEDLSIDHFQFWVSGSMRYYDGDVKLKGILKMNFYLS